MLIDEEIIKYYIGKDGFVSLQRGQCGTRAVEHKAGSKVRLIGGYYNHIAPRPDSELYYEIAHRTARAYNEGGFKGIYFDALDGLGVHLHNVDLDDYIWYYGAKFINEVLKYCIVPPTVECATLYPTIWSARDRGGAWDTPYRGYKDFIDEHISVNKTLHNRYYYTTLGWYNFYPLSLKLPQGYSTKYMFFDDIDYLGTKAIAYNQYMVYERLKENEINTIPGLRRNLDLYANYNQLRTKSYFSEKVKAQLRTGKYEYRLKRIKGQWAFQEAAYCRSKIRDISFGRLTGNNPFKRQKPFIRIENLYSSECKKAVSLFNFDETVDAIQQHRIKEFSPFIDIDGHYALSVQIKGNGENSKDAVCIRLTSPGNTDGYADFVVKTNFDGWKNIVLSDLDNAEYHDLHFKGMDYNLYKTHRYPLNYSRVSSIQLFYSGDCKDVKLKAINAVELTPNPLTYPSVYCGSSYVMFLDTLQSGEYIEYQAGEKEAIAYDLNGNSRKVTVKRKGLFLLPNGDFSAFVKANEGADSIPSQVVLTFGLYGKYLTN